MIAVDTNVLVYAHRPESRLHQAARERLRALAEGTSLWGLPVFCLSEFVRVVTHPRVFAPPTPLELAVGEVLALLDSPSVRLLTPGPRYPALFRETCLAAQAVGNLAFDAQIAAVCQEHGATQLLTADRDFARFPALTPMPI